MTREEIVSGNILIARYMEATDTGDTRLIDDVPEPLYELSVGNDKIHYVENTGYTRAIYSPQHLQYNRDWNWLLPVVKKVLNDLQDIKDKNQGDSPVYGECIETEGWIIGALLDIEMEGVYKGVVQAVKIINTNK